MPNPPSVLLIDDGELEDVHALVQELGADSLRLRSPENLAEWPPPTALLVATARRALSLRLPPGWEGSNGPTTIAVVDEDSRTLRTLLLRAGFQYLVRRPVHPHALRLLLLRGLFRGHESRREPRFPFGYDVRWRTGWRRRKGTLVEISPDGCRLVASGLVAPGLRVAIRIPREAAGGRALTLQGRVVRCDREASRAEAIRWAFAVVFDPLSSRTRERLVALLAERSIGPARLPRAGKLRRPLAPPAQRDGAAAAKQPEGSGESAAVDASGGGLSLLSLRVRLLLQGVLGGCRRLFDLRGRLGARLAEEAAEPVALRSSRDDRRQRPRGSFHQELVALEEEAERVIHVFVGRDLSAGGVRVEPHPSLSTGDRLRLAIYDASFSDPVIVDAEVVRDDGDRGLALQFNDIGPGAIHQIQQIVSTLPAVEALYAASAEPQGLVIAELLPGDPASHPAPDSSLD